jgi:hypothetical protein
MMMIAGERNKFELTDKYDHQEVLRLNQKEKDEHVMNHQQLLVVVEFYRKTRSDIF